jgi:predicted aspartyl protease
MAGKMTNMCPQRSVRAWTILAAVAIGCWAAAAWAERPGWQRDEVNWRVTGGSIKAVHYPVSQPLPLLSRQGGRRADIEHKQIVPARSAVGEMSLVLESAPGPIVATLIDSPPVSGFVPWIVVTVTDERLEDLEFEAVPQTSVVGNYPAIVNPQTDYIIGIFDTGASAHVMGYAGASRAGLFYGYPVLLTSNIITVAGVIGTVDALVSMPLGLFIDGLGALEPDGLLLNTSGMVGETNVAIVVGDDPGGMPDLPTAIGTPLSVYFTTVINNEQQITVTRDSEEFTGPDVRIYEHEDPRIPTYPNIIPLELRPLGGQNVQYVPSMDDLFEFPPMSPSIIVGNSSQSLFFVHSVDLKEGDKSAIDKNRFMLDTGAQVSVVGSRIAARLALNIANPEFEVEIQDVTGETVMAPGYYIDSLEIPALGEWLSFTNVPVVLLNVYSPEGGTLDGIIGMNLFSRFNLVLRGGGLFLQDDPTLEFEPIPEPIVGDIAPEDGDRKVDYLDLTAFADAWLATPQSQNWNARADLAPPTPDELINFLDFAILAEHWLENAAP